MAGRIEKFEVSAVWFTNVESPTEPHPEYKSRPKFHLSFPGDELPAEIAEEFPQLAKRIQSSTYGLCSATSYVRPLIDIRPGHTGGNAESVRLHMHEHWCSFDTMLTGAAAKLAVTPIKARGPRSAPSEKIESLHLVAISVSASDLFYPSWDQPKNPRIDDFRESHRELTRQ
jgi:hypothetical protein